MNKISICLILCIFYSGLSAVEPLQTGDSIPLPKKNIFKHVYEYFEKSNDVDPNKRFDFSIIGGPHYSNDTKVGLGLVASGLFRVDRDDLELSPSNVSIYSDITTSGSYMIGVSGNVIFPRMDYRIDADIFFANRPSKYWGVGYNYGKRDDDYSEFTTREIYLKGDFLKKIFDLAYVGISASYRNSQGKDFDDINYLQGEDHKSVAIGAGLILSYDSRDFIPNPYSGIYTKIEQTFYPRKLGSSSTFNKTEIIFRYYQQAWKGAILAFDLQGIFNNGNVPWNMMALMGSSYQMRGYFAGQYRDKKLIQTQVELRQKVYRRNSIVAWVGAGNVFPDFSDFDWGHTLPTFGIGYRWEFKKRVNVRLDYGFGKGQ